MGQVVNAWATVIDTTLSTLFDGSDGSINTLTTMISDGKMIDGNGAYPNGTVQNSTDIHASVAKTFFAYAIPAIWSVSGRAPFIVDSGYACGTVDPLSQYMSTDTMHATAGCYNGQLYYLASLSGSSESCAEECTPNLFSAPPGLDSLDGQSWGGVTLSDLITG